MLLLVGRALTDHFQRRSAPDVYGRTFSCSPLSLGGAHQFLTVDVSHSNGRTGIWFERVLHNDRYFYDVVHTLRGEDAEFGAGLRGVFHVRELDVEWLLGAVHRYNFNFGSDANNVKSMIAVAWTPR